MRNRAGLCIIASSPFTFLSAWLSLKLIMDYSGVKRVLPLFVHKKKKRGRMKAIRGKNGRVDGRMDGSSIEKKGGDRLFFLKAG